MFEGDTPWNVVGNRRAISLGSEAYVVVSDPRDQAPSGDCLLHPVGDPQGPLHRGRNRHLKEKGGLAVANPHPAGDLDEVAPRRMWIAVCN